MIVKAVITTLDNLPILKEQVAILRDDPLIDEIVVVNNGSRDGTALWLAGIEGVTVVNRANLGAGPGRNAGLDAAGEFDYVLMLDGGIRPLRGGTAVMFDYLVRHPEVDVVSPEVMTSFTADPELAHRRMGPVDESTCFPQRALSSTAYCLCRARAWDGIRFSEEGPFAQPGWGVDDNEMACRWNFHGILHHDFGGTMVYRRESGSFARLFEETGIWPNQYGSTYESRCVLLRQRWPEYFDPEWKSNKIEVSVVILAWNEYPTVARAVKRYHEDLKEVPHEVILVDNGSDDLTKWWLDTFALRWPWGDTVIDAETGEIIKRHEREDLEPVWTGNVIRVDMGRNAGLAGYNAGIEAARGRYVFVTDGDILPTVGSVASLYRYMENKGEEFGISWLGVSAWACQEEEEDPDWTGDHDELPRFGMGNYAYGYSIAPREVFDDGARYPTTGPFATGGCAYGDAEIASWLYASGRRGWFFYEPGYFHQRRDLERQGELGEEETKRNLELRRRWLRTRWVGQKFTMEWYHEQDEVERRLRRVAVVGLGHDQLGNTAFGIARALEGVCEVDCYLPTDEVPPGYDDYFFSDGHCFLPCPDHCRPSTYWACDIAPPNKVPWLPPPEKYLERARTMDRVFATQPSGAAWLTEQGVPTPWLPSAAEPGMHRPWPDEEVELDWIALWHNNDVRMRYVQAAAARFPNGWVSYKTGDEYARWMCKARCALNVSRNDELNFRPFEIAAMGVPLIADRCRGIMDLFEEGTHFRGFDVDDMDEMVDQIAWVLEHPEEAAEMAARARALVLGRHTYLHRALAMFGG